MEEYIVQPGDTLKSIAAKKLGDQKRWQEIAQLNNLQNTNHLLIGQRLKLPAKQVNTSLSPFASNLPNGNEQQTPASIVPGRGYAFVVFEQLPKVGAENVIRKVQVVPMDFSLKPKNPLANYSLAEHALKGNILNTQLLSASDKPHGSPTMGKFNPFDNADGYKEVLLIDTKRAAAGGSRVYSVEEVVADLRRHAALEPNNKGLQQQVEKIIRVIEKVEGEVLIENGVNGKAVKKVSTTHLAYIETADDIWAARKAGKITLEQAEERLAALTKAYERARIVGRVGRVVSVIGVVMTAADMGIAGKKSYDKQSFRPLAAETVRQVGGWTGAYTGAVAGGAFGAAIGVETGPGLIITGAIGAIVFGAIGYWRGDVIAGWIDPPEETLNELRKDVNFAEELKNRDIGLVVTATENQYEFRRRALKEAAVEVQKQMLNSDIWLPERFAQKFAPILASSNTSGYHLNWIKNSDNKNPESDTNNNGSIDDPEWNLKRGKLFTYRLDKGEVDELIRMLFGISR